VRFRAFGESGLDFALLVWIDEAWMRGRATDALNCAIYKAFAEAGIEIPYPKRDVYVKGWTPPPG
jgi:small-conductance mechanosensitive channel